MEGILKMQGISLKIWWRGVVDSLS